MWIFYLYIYTCTYIYIYINIQVYIYTHVSRNPWTNCTQPSKRSSWQENLAPYLEQVILQAPPCCRRALGTAPNFCWTHPSVKNHGFGTAKEGTGKCIEHRWFILFPNSGRMIYAWFPFQCSLIISSEVPSGGNQPCSRPRYLGPFVFVMGVFAMSRGVPMATMFLGGEIGLGHLGPMMCCRVLHFLNETIYYFPTLQFEVPPSTIQINHQRLRHHEQSSFRCPLQGAGKLAWRNLDRPACATWHRPATSIPFWRTVMFPDAALV